MSVREPKIKFWVIKDKDEDWGFWPSSWYLEDIEETFHKQIVSSENAKRLTQSEIEKIIKFGLKSNDL